MWRVRFGNQPVWTRELAHNVDRVRFQSTFGDLKGVDPADYDCIVPLSFADYEVLQNHQLFWGNKYWSPTPALVELCDDKLLLNQWLLENDFAELTPPLPEKNHNQFPYIVKKRRDWYGNNSFVIRNKDDERTMAPSIESPEYFCQAYIAGNVEFALHLLLVNDEVAYSHTVKYEFAERAYVMGHRFKAKKRSYPASSSQLATFVRVLSKLGYTGTCCVDYKMDGETPKILEINPRFGSSLSHDVNRYLEAYLGSLGVIDKSEFHYHGLAPVQDKLGIRARMWLRSQTPRWMRQLVKSARS